MKALTRPSAPACLADAEEGPALRVAWYDDLRKSDGAIKDRWNSQDPDEQGVSSIRRALSKMSDGECAWCGVRLDQWQVDHYLPQKRFPYVAYCWDNLLPACPRCNRRKSGYVPPGLAARNVVDPALAERHPAATPFSKTQILPFLEERLVDPSFDDPAAHLEFVAAIPMWRGRTRQGELTVARFFAEKEDAQRWHELSEFIKACIDVGVPAHIFEDYADLHGCRTVIGALIAHWRDMLSLAPAGQSDAG